MATNVPSWVSHGPCCLVNKCRDEGCRITLPRRARLAVISGSEYQSNHMGEGIPLCDFICFWDAGSERHVVALELKGRVHAGQSLRQLQRGAVLADEVISSEEVSFLPVLASSKRIHTMELRVLRQGRICFRGRRYLTTLAHCGDNLTQLVS